MTGGSIHLYCTAYCKVNLQWEWEPRAGGSEHLQKAALARISAGRRSSVRENKGITPHRLDLTTPRFFIKHDRYFL
jgi:hypothetical protein